MTDIYTPSQAVAWIEKRKAEWAALSDNERALRAMYGKVPETMHDGAPDDLLSTLRAGTIVATNAAGDVLPKTKWMAADAEHLCRAQNVPAHLSWLHGVRLDAVKVRKRWRSETAPTTRSRRSGKAVERDVQAFAKLAIATGKKVKRGDFVAACQAETRCQRKVAEAAYVALPDTVRVLRGEKVGKR